jgi:hypothetical protein
MPSNSRTWKGESLLDATRFDHRKGSSPCRPRRPRALNLTTSRTKSKLAFVTTRSGSSFCFRSLTKMMASMTPASHGQTPAFKSNSGCLRSRKQYPTMPLCWNRASGSDDQRTTRVIPCRLWAQERVKKGQRGPYLSDCRLLKATNHCVRMLRSVSNSNIESPLTR